MVLALAHFCTKTGKPILVGGEPLVEIINSCIAEKLHPDVKFAVGTVYPGLTTEADFEKLKEEKGWHLYASHKDRFFFADRPAKELRESIFDKEHFAAAYGSNLFTQTESMEEVGYEDPNGSGRTLEIGVLIADGTTGECGGILPPEQGRLLVGDGDGRIDRRLHEQLGNPENTQFQVRGFIPVQEEKGIRVNQLIKGTLAPEDLNRITNGQAQIVLSTDQLKGRKNVVNPSGILDPVTGKPVKIGNELKPGLYKIQLSLGKVTDANWRDASTGAQFWNCLPEGAQKDALPRIEARLKKLNEIGGDPRLAARDYMKTVEQREKGQLKKQITKEGGDVDFWEDFSSPALEAFGDVFEQGLGNESQDKTYKLLAADLEAHLQLIETHKISNALAEYTRTQYRDCAIGRTVKFKSGMAKTNNALKDGEITAANFPDGKEIIIYRPPVSNSNVMGVLINRIPKDRPLYPDSLEMTRQTMHDLNIDTDGDTPIVALAEDYPNTTKEIKNKTAPENRYAAIVTPEKAEYKGTFEQISLMAIEDKTGIVANAAMKALAQEHECQLLPEEEKERFLKDLSNSFLENFESISSPPSGVEILADDRISKLAALAGRFDSADYQQNPLTKDEINEYLDIARSVFRDGVSMLSQQLEIEVQSGKSANRSDPEVLEYFGDLCKFPKIAWLKQKKLDETYLDTPIESHTHGPIDYFVKATNKVFQNNVVLAARSTDQFRDLFKGVSYSEKQLKYVQVGKKTECQGEAVDIKNKYDSLVRSAISIDNDVAVSKRDSSLLMVAKSKSGNQLEIIMTAKKTKHPQALDLNELQKVALMRDTKDPQKWVVAAAVLDKNNKPELKENGKILREVVGTLSATSTEANRETIQKLIQTQKNSNDLDLGTLSAEVFPGYNQSHVTAAFAQVTQYVEQVRATIPEQDRKSMAAAMWQLSTVTLRDGKENDGSAGAAFAIFNDEIVERLSKLQFTELTATGLNFPETNQHYGRTWTKERVPIEVTLETDPSHPHYGKRCINVEGQRLALIYKESASLPVGTRAVATIDSQPGSSILAKTQAGNTLKITQTKNYAFPDKVWLKENQPITLGLYKKDPKSPVAVVALVGDQILGELDKPSVEKLREIDALYALPTRIKLDVELTTSPEAAAKVVIDPSSVVYPERWTNEKSLPPVKSDNQSASESTQATAGAAAVTPQQPSADRTLEYLRSAYRTATKLQALDLAGDIANIGKALKEGTTPVPTKDLLNTIYVAHHVIQRDAATNASRSNSQTEASVGG